MKKLVVLLLIVCICLPVFAACSTLQGDDDKGANISVFLTSFPHTFDPAAVQMDASTALIYGLIYQPLTTINADGEVEAALAKNWYAYYDDRDEIYKMYFELNETYWSDNIAVQAQHVADAWTRILSPEMQSPYASLLMPIRNAKAYKSGVKTKDDLGVYAEGDYLLCVEFEEEYDINLFAEAVSCIALSPVRQDIIDYATKQNPVDGKNYDRLQDWDKNAAVLVCNGPYRIQGYEEGTKLVLERNSGYYRDLEDDALDESVIPFRLTCILQETTLAGKDIKPEDTINVYDFEYKKWEDGKLYFMSAFNKDTFAKFTDVNTKDLLSTYSYFFNTREGHVTENAKVRQALSVALDRNRIVEIIGTGVKAAIGWVPDGVFDKTTGSSFRAAGTALYNASADAAKAKSLLSEAGVSSGNITLVYYIPWTTKLYSSDVLHLNEVNKVKTYNVYEQIAEYAKEAWTALGFTVELKGVNADGYQKELSNGNWDVFGIDFAGNSVDAYTYLAPFTTSMSGNTVKVSLEDATFTPHYTGLENDEYDTLLNSIMYVSDREKRAEVLHNAEAMFGELCPAAALIQYTRSYVVSDKLSKVKEDSWYGYIDLTQLRLDDYIEVNSKEAEESLAAQAGLAEEEK